MEGLDDGKEWNEAWSSMPHRRILSWAPDLKDWFGYDFGNVAAATISPIPVQYIDQMYFSPGLCPVCGSRPEHMKRIPVCVSTTVVS